MVDIPLGLRNSLESGNCVLFLGAGVGGHLTDQAGQSAPDGVTLARELGDHFGIDAGAAPDLMKISKLVEIRKGRQVLELFLKKRLANLEPDEKLRSLLTRRWRAIFTTNYDNSIKRGFELVENPQQNPIIITSTSEIVDYDARFQVPIYYLHGALFGEETTNIVITDDDYSTFRESRKMLFELLKKEFITCPILYVGYSNRDPNWKLVLSEITTEFYPSPLPKSFRLDPFADDYDIEIMSAKNIDTVKANIADFSDTIAAELPIDAGVSDRLAKLKVKIPADFLGAFEQNPAPVVRLLSSWVYVNDANFAGAPNIHNFLRGDRPNWGLIGNKDVFVRDIEEDVYNDVIDFATMENVKPFQSVILGSAGYGVTTLLMTIAASIIKEKAGAVLFLKPGHQLLEGDIDFALSAIKGNVYFVIDNAADNHRVLAVMIQKLRDEKKTCYFLVGDRINEWRQVQGKVSFKEFVIEPLSDPEIYRLIDYLERHNELNTLESLTKELQFTAIKNVHGKELLIAMREATENKSFDAILEDEFWGIGDTFSRTMYLYVCFFYQHGAFVRASLLADLLGVDVAELYARTRSSTEGVVLFDCLNESTGMYGGRARHRTIANIVWDRCGDAAEKEDIIYKALESINLTFKADKDAFEYFTKSDYIVDSIRTLEGKTKFFEIACRKDAVNPYVRQHYSRMLMRENKHDLALSQIDEALKFNQRLRTLYHTKGVVLMHMAHSAESSDIGRRRMAQSESMFRKCLSMYPRDDYSYQGLAQLYIGWAKKRAESPEEVAEYVGKAEGIISEGLRVVRVRDALYIESSSIQQLIGDEPSYLRALENAVRVNDASVIARYLLGRAYRKAKRYDDAIKVLDYVIKNFVDEFRCFIEYALCLVYKNEPYPRAIAVMSLSTLYGYSDPRYLATLGGMYFLNQQFEEATRIFGETGRRNFTANELNAIQFIPPDPTDTSHELRFTGSCIRTKPGYSLVEVPGYPPFLLPGSKYDGMVIYEGIKMSFVPAFTARGNVAHRPLPI